MNKEQLYDKYGDEQVLSIKNSYLSVLDREGVDKVKALMVLIGNNAAFEYRYNAELDFQKKQVIPYVVLKNKGKYFVTKRIDGDSRLVGQLSIAVGGHINPCDVLSFDRPSEIVSRCIVRELSEETTVELSDIIDWNYVTTFIDESTEVSKVHVCLLTKVLLGTSKVDIKETDKLEGCWMDANEIKENYDSFENWSRIVIDLLLGKEGV